MAYISDYINTYGETIIWFLAFLIFLAFLKAIFEIMKGIWAWYKWNK